MDLEQNNIYIVTNYIVNSISILLLSLLLTTIIILKIKEISFSNRISLRLISYITVMEILFSIFQMLRIDSYRYSLRVSYFLSWGNIFSSLLICFLFTSIFINIQLTLKYKDIKYLKKFYLMISIALAVTLSITPILFEKLRFDFNRRYFWFTTIAWEWINYQIWIVFSILYCAISSILLLYHLDSLKKPKKRSQIIPYNTNIEITNLSSDQQNQSKVLSKYVFRLTFYSLVPLLSYLPTIISSLAQSSPNNFSLNLLSLIFISSQGIFTFLIFLFDPIIDEVILEHKNFVKQKQTVLESVKRGVYVHNIYDIDRELPSSREKQQHKDDNNDNNDNNNRSKKHRSIKNRISMVTSVIYNYKKKSVDVKSDNPFNLYNDDDLLYLL